MEILLGALALFVCFLIVPAFLLGLGFTAAIPLVVLGFAGSLISGTRARGPEEDRQRIVRELERDRAA